jgi:tRNA pseudouridine38-40 synthase
MNFKLTLQYDGTDFHGWQMQGNLRTVQAELTRALSLIEGHDVVVHGSGRTDAGVHAEGQVASVILSREITPEKLRAAINGNVGRDLRVINVEIVSDDFHARFSAVDKTYIYRVVNGPVISPFWLRYAHHEARNLDCGSMRFAAGSFIGTHDWTAFSAADSDIADRIRTVSRLDVHDRWDERASSKMIEVTATANGFLRAMVRSIVGTLLAIGHGELDQNIVNRALSTCDRSLSGPTAPAKGLTLLNVKYAPNKPG